MPEEVLMPKQPENWQIRDIAHPKGYTVTASNFMQQAVKGHRNCLYPNILEQEMPAQGQQVKLYTPVKKKKKQKQLFLFDQLLSAAANKIRQPIESLSGRPEEKTRIQIASEVRSYNGLSVHISGKLAAMFILIMNP